MDTPCYKNFTEKNGQFFQNYKIDSENDFDDIIKNLKAKEKDFLYRGVNNATYKLYSSSQVQWMKSVSTDIEQSKDDYYNWIYYSIDLTSKNNCVKQYIKSNNIPENDIFILALMQHYGIPSPVLDFSHSILGALYFACAGLKDEKRENQEQLSDYISLYVINRNIDWVSCSIQETMKDGAERLDRMLKDVDLPKVDTTDVEEDFRQLHYRKLIKDGISFISVDDNPENPEKISIQALNFECGYQITNARIITQQGMFIANNTFAEPLAELMNDKCGQKYFVCYNIHKKLVKFIKEKYLNKEGINETSMYCKGDQESNNLDTALTELRDSVLLKLKNAETN